MKLSKSIFIFVGLLIGLYMISISAFVPINKDGAVCFGLIGFVTIIFCLHYVFYDQNDKE